MRVVRKWKLGASPYVAAPVSAAHEILQSGAHPENLSSKKFTNGKSDSIQETAFRVKLSRQS